MIQKLGAKPSSLSARASSPVAKQLKQVPKAPTAFKRDELSTGRGGALRARAQKYLGTGKPPPPGPALAISQAHALFMSPGGQGEIGGTVTHFLSVCDHHSGNAAEALVARNAALEQKAVASLSAADQQRYAELRTELTFDPAAQLALQTMLLEGRLPGAKDLVDGKTLLQQLDRLSNQELDPGLEGADQLLAQTVREIFIPAGIAQGLRGTCAATSSLASLATANPAEYVRLVAGLASPEGTVELANGQQLVREPGTLSEDAYGRSVVQRLLGPAAMEYANGIFNYDNESDLNGLPVPGPLGELGIGGLTPGMAEGLLEGLFGSEFTASNGLLGLLSGDGQALMANNAIAAVEAGQTPVAVAMSFPAFYQGHMLVLDRVERTSQGVFVILRNPWGQEERVPYDAFKSHLSSVVTPG